MARLAQIVVFVSCFFVTYTFPKGDNTTAAQQTLTSGSIQSITKEQHEEDKLGNDTNCDTTVSLEDGSGKGADSSEGLDTVFNTQHLAQVKNNPCKDGYFRDWNNMCRKLE